LVVSKTNASHTNTEKVARSHPEVKVEEYRCGQRMPDGEDEIFQTAANQIDLAHPVTRKEDKFGLWVALFRTFEDGVLLTTFFRSSRRSYLKTLERRGERLR